MELNSIPSIFLISIRICDVLNFSLSVFLFLHSHPDLLRLVVVNLRFVHCKDTLSTASFSSLLNLLDLEANPAFLVASHVVATYDPHI